MTVTSAANKITYSGNGATTAFGFNFAVESAADIQVYYTNATGIVTLLNALQYSISINAAVSPNPTPVGGLVTYPLSGPPIATGTKLTILRSTAVTQPASYANQGTLYPTSIEQSFDAAIMLIQQLGEVIGRQLTVAVSDTTPGLLPSATQRASQVLGFDSSGNPIAVSTVPAGQISSAMAPVCNAASIAAAQALLGINAAGYVPVGTEFDYAGIIAPQFFFWSLGFPVGRTNFPELFAAIAPVISATILNGNPVVTIGARADGAQPTTGFKAGMPVEAAGVISPGTTVLSLTNTTITLTSNPIAGGSSLRIFPHGNGDGSTTYNLPQSAGYTYAGLDPQNGFGRLTKSTAQGVDGSGVANVGGEQAHTSTTGEMPVHNHTITDPQHAHTLGAAAPVVIAAVQGGANPISAVNANGNTGNAATGITINNTGSGNPHNNAQPTSIRMKIIFAGRATF